MFKVNYKATKATPLAIVNFEHISHLCSSVSIVNFEHVIAAWVFTYHTRRNLGAMSAKSRESTNLLAITNDFTDTVPLRSLIF